MRTVGLSQSDITSIYSVLSAILLIKNVQIVDSGSGYASIDSTCRTDFSDSCQLLSMDARKLEHEFLNKTTVTGGSTQKSPCLVPETERRVPQFLQTLYDQLFTYVVSAVNRSIGPDPTGKFIGILDVFGFHEISSNSEEHSLEHLFINSANDLFIKNFVSVGFVESQKEVFTQSEALKTATRALEEVGMSRQGQRKAIFSVLRDLASAPKEVTDDNFITALAATFRSSEYACVKKIDTQKGTFTVNHRHSDVTYSSRGIVAKNADTIPVAISDLGKASPNTFVQRLFQNTKGAVVPGKFDGSLLAVHRFVDELLNLVDSVNRTERLYIKCIRPSEEGMKDNDFSEKLVIHQLKALGLLEGVSLYKEIVAAERRYCIKLIEARWKHQIYYKLWLERKPKLIGIQSYARMHLASIRGWKNLK